ncbi:RusA family crossover junction endodeoxyribonuclease [Enterobacter kobei]|uniref:RusA family crossover junction endodeoxyribonuclease n=1 Tax=Enterobacter kobei TaxID=208224 RepID=UPI00387EC052
MRVSKGVGNSAVALTQTLRPTSRTLITAFQPTQVEIILYPPDARRRDIDNYNKALFDALTHAGIWEDDSQVKRMLVEWAPQVPGGKVEITIASYVENGRQNSNALVRA